MIRGDPRALWRVIKAANNSPTVRQDAYPTSRTAKPSAQRETRMVYCGDNMDQLAKWPDAPPGRRKKDKSFFKRRCKFIDTLTVQEILVELIANKLG